MDSVTRRSGASTKMKEGVVWVGEAQEEVPVFRAGQPPVAGLPRTRPRGGGPV
jgi:hypothetical protein